MALYRSRSDRIVGGVCGGMAKSAFPGILVYLILWLVVPQEP